MYLLVFKAMIFFFAPPADASHAPTPCAHSPQHPPSLCCGRAVEHSVGRLRHTGQISGFDQLERVLSAVFGLDGRLRASKKCESTGAVGHTVGGGGGKATNTS